MIIQRRHVIGSICVLSLLVVLSVCEAGQIGEQWTEIGDVTVAGKLKANRSLQFGFAPGISSIGFNDIGKVVLEGPPLEKGDVTATGQLNKQDGTIIAEFKDVEVMWNDQVRAFQFDVDNWRVHMYPTPSGSQIPRVFSSKK